MEDFLKEWTLLAFLVAGACLSLSAAQATNLSTTTHKTLTSIVTSAPSVVTSIPTTTTSRPVSTFSLSENGKICLKAAFKGVVSVGYKAFDQKTNQTGIRLAHIPIPTDAKVTGHCKNKTNEAQLSLAWTHFSLSMVFEFSKISPVWMGVGMSFTYDTKDAEFASPIKIGQHSSSTNNGKVFFETPKGSSYKCESMQVFNLTSDNNDTVALTTSDLRLQAFKLPKSGEFDSDQVECLADIGSPPANNIVPIIVAGCLAGVILIVIIAYFISRKSSKPSYQSME